MWICIYIYIYVHACVHLHTRTQLDTFSRRLTQIARSPKQGKDLSGMKSNICLHGRTQMDRNPEQGKYLPELNSIVSLHRQTHKISNQNKAKTFLYWDPIFPDFFKGPGAGQYSFWNGSQRVFAWINAGGEQLGTGQDLSKLTCNIFAKVDAHE